MPEQDNIGLGEQSKKSLFYRVKNWYNGANDYNDFFTRPKTWLIGGIVALGLGLGFNKGNDIKIEDSTCQGHVVDFGRKGIIWTTYEGSFALGGINRSETGYFSLDEQVRNGENLEELASKLKEAVETGKSVRVHGTRPLFCWPWRSGVNYHIDSVEFIDE